MHEARATSGRKRSVIIDKRPLAYWYQMWKTYCFQTVQADDSELDKSIEHVDWWLFNDLLG
jgi:hypothetical protein